MHGIGEGATSTRVVQPLFRPPFRRSTDQAWVAVRRSPSAVRRSPFTDLKTSSDLQSSDTCIWVTIVTMLSAAQIGAPEYTAFHPCFFISALISVKFCGLHPTRLQQHSQPAQQSARKRKATGENATNSINVSTGGM